jgi:two-component system sensor histidine kinase DegS
VVHLNRPWSQRYRELYKNPHFWVLLIIIIIITILYCSLVFLGFRPDWLRRIEVIEFQMQFHGILFCIPIVYAAVIFWWRGALITWLISLIISVPLAFYYRPFPSPLLVNVFYLCIPVLVVGSVALELNWRQKEKELLVKREEERQLYVAQIFKAQEDERKRIAQGLHDDTIHSLLVIANQVQGITGKNSKTEEQLNSQAQTIRGEVLRVSDDLRRLILDLRPGVLDNVGLIPALIWLIDRLNQEGQIDAKLIIEGEERDIPHGTDVILFRIIQEALNNIRLHSQATEVTITIEFGAEIIKIIVHDNGKGFTVPKRLSSLASKGKLGLIGIQERVHSLKGSLLIQSKPKNGANISIEVKV